MTYLVSLSTLMLFLNVFSYTGRVEAMAIRPSHYLWCDPSGAKTSLGGLCRACLGDNTFHVRVYLDLL